MKLIYEHVESLAHLTREDKDGLLAIIAENDATFSKNDYDIGKVKYRVVRNSYTQKYLIFIL